MVFKVYVPRAAFNGIPFLGRKQWRIGRKKSQLRNVSEHMDANCTRKKSLNVASIVDGPYGF